MIPATEPPRTSTSSSCDRHPEEHFYGSFCTTCLIERLSGLNTASTPSHDPAPASTSTAVSAIKSIFTRSASVRFVPELRRTQSFSASRCEVGSSSVAFEPQRRSCDVRGRRTLWTLFSQDDEAAARSGNVANPDAIAAPNQVPRSSIPVSIRQRSEIVDEIVEENSFVRVVDESFGGTSSRVEDTVEAIVEEVVVERDQILSMKDHFDEESSQSKKPSGQDFKKVAGSFWTAASVFSKKLGKWRQKQKLKKGKTVAFLTTLPVEKPMGMHFRKTQSEIADYGFGRRSCDTEPRFSLDAGRMSFDDGRYLFDEPRASWDGYMTGNGRAISRLTPILSHMEDAAMVHASRFDTLVSIKESVDLSGGEDHLPGGSSQTRDYYLDSSSKRRRSFERSVSIKKTAAAVVAEMEEMKSLSNSKVSPASVHCGKKAKSMSSHQGVRDRRTNPKTVRDDVPEASGVVFRDDRDAISVVWNDSSASNATEKKKKSWRWSKTWKFWGSMNWRSRNKDEVDDRFSRENGAGMSYSESWQEPLHCRSVDANGAFDRNFLRSNSVRSRNSDKMEALSSSRMSTGNINMDGRQRDQLVFERNQSTVHSPKHANEEQQKR